MSEPGGLEQVAKAGGAPSPTVVGSTRKSTEKVMGANWPALLDMLLFAMFWSALIGWIEGWLFSLTHRGFGLIGNVLVAFLGAFLGFLFFRFAAATMSEDGLIYGIAGLVGAVFGG